jgi:hypothetical protein
MTPQIGLIVRAGIMRAKSEMLRLRLQLFVDLLHLQPWRVIANFSRFRLYYQGKNREIFPALDRGLPRVLVEPLIQPCRASASNAPRHAQMQGPHAPEKNPARLSTRDARG